MNSTTINKQLADKLASSQSDETQLQMMETHLYIARQLLENTLDNTKPSIGKLRDLLARSQNPKAKGGEGDGSVDQGLWYQVREIISAYDKLIEALNDDRQTALAKAETKRRRGEVYW